MSTPGAPEVQLRLTLDTNSIIYAFDEKHETPVQLDEVHAIISHALGGKVNLALTTAMSRDLEGDTDDERRAKLLNAVSMFPAIGAPARYGVTRFDAGDVLASDAEAEVGQRVESIVFPASIGTDSKRWKNKANDVDHLVAHWRERRDAFVTTDAPILRRAEALQGELGIRVLAPVDALDLVERTGIAATAPNRPNDDLGLPRPSPRRAEDANPLVPTLRYTRRRP